MIDELERQRLAELKAKQDMEVKLLDDLTVVSWAAFTLKIFPCFLKVNFSLSV